jgi:ribosome biogenesis protein Tsr3
LISTSHFAYGDSCQTGDDKYVIAQFRSDSSLGWVHDLRSFLNKPELKYKWFHPERHRVMGKSELWKKVENGISQAEITIVDPRVYREFSILEWLDQQAEPGIDFDERTINEETGLLVIECSPLRIAQNFNADWRFARFAPFSGEATGVGDFRAATLKRRAGGKLKDAIVVAARAHAMISPTERRDLVERCALSGASDFDSAVASIKKMSRIFDEEHAKSVPILNEFSARLAHAAGVRGVSMFHHGAIDPVAEADSKDAEHLQAADMAAGWAVDILTLTNGDYRSLAQKFAWVGVNGVVIPE